MKEHPILFSGEMVRSILEGEKTQTRRVMKPQPTFTPWTNESKEGFWGWWKTPRLFYDSIHAKFEQYCPYGQPGDLLWVRESHLIQLEPCDDYPAGYVVYKADFQDGATAEPGWRPSIHMPRWASRITLEVTNVRVERVQEISEADAVAEGIDLDVIDMAAVSPDYLKQTTSFVWDDKYYFQEWSSDLPGYVSLDRLAQVSYQTLWDSINAKRGYSFESNPWVWVIEFTPKEVIHSSPQEKE